MSKMGKKKKKKFPKAFMMVGDKKVCVDDLIEEVNKYDKEFGIRLKHPDAWRNPQMYRQVIEAKADMNLAALICIINGLEVNEYFESDESDSQLGTICKPIGVKNIEFTDLSFLDWTKKTLYNTDSLKFRCRFLTLVITQLIGKIDKITEQEVETKRGFFHHSKDEQRIMITKDIVLDTFKLVRCMLTPDNSYKNIILKVTEHVSYTKKKYDHNKLKNLINGHIVQLRNNMKKDPLTGRFLTDDMAIYSILKIAYMLTTSKTNLGTLPRFKYIEKATVKHDLSKLIEELGAQIIRNNGEKMSPMFTAFKEARPSIWTQFHEKANKNLALKTGITALEYAKFVINDRTIDKFINEMKKAGI
jgi:hypothetical protein